MVKNKMNQKEQTEIINKILNNFQRLKTENAKLKLANEKLKKEIESTNIWLSNRCSLLSEKIKENKKLEKENKDLKDALYNCEEMLYLFKEVQYKIEDNIDRLKAVNKRVKKKYGKYKQYNPPKPTPIIEEPRNPNQCGFIFMG